MKRKVNIEVSKPLLLRPYILLAEFFLFVQIPGISRVTVGTLLFLPLLKEMLDEFNFSKRLGQINKWAIATLGATLILPLATLQIDSNRDFDWSIYTTVVLAVFQFYIIVLAVFYGVRQTSLGIVLALIALGATLNFLQITEGDPTINPWKYYLVWPISLLVILVSSRLPFLFSLVCFIPLCVLSASTGSRNSLLVLSLVLLSILFLKTLIIRSRLDSNRLNIFFGVVLISVFFLTPLFLSLVSQGALGVDLQTRQLEQMQIGFLGGRVESTVGLGLIANSPIGIGAGVEPSTHDRIAGLDSFSRILNPDAVSTSYVQSKVLGISVELHSVVLNFWVIASVIGLFFGFICLRLMLTSLGHIIKTRYSSACLFVLFQGFWDMLFSPLVVNAKYCGVAIAVAALLIYGIEREAKQFEISHS